MDSNKSLNRSHNIAAEIPAKHGDKPNIARDASRGAAAFDLKIHNGMQTQSKVGPAFGGDHKSALDSLSGQVTVPGKPGAAATAHPLTAPPTAKNLRPVEIKSGMRSLTSDASTMQDLGRRMLDEATAGSVNHRHGIDSISIGRLPGK